LSPARKPQPNKEKNVTNETTEPTPVEVAPETPTETDTVEKGSDNPEHHDDTDVDAILDRETHDGKGDSPVPPADFASFAAKGVENIPADELDRIASGIISGQFGSDEHVIREELEFADFNPSTVFAEVNRRISEGAPSALPKPSVRDLATQVIRGEWGGEDREIKRRLEGAGHTVKTVYAEVEKQLGG
jgi:hypothetical protein